MKKLFLSKRKSFIIYDFPHFPYTYNEEIRRYFSETRNDCVFIFCRRYQTDPVRGLTDAKAKANLGRVHLPAFSCFNIPHYCISVLRHEFHKENQLAELLQLILYRYFPKRRFQGCVLYSTGRWQFCFTIKSVLATLFGFFRLFLYFWDMSGFEPGDLPW
jgi:hypothetical protein